jgi:hypothetical protein
MKAVKRLFGRKSKTRQQSSTGSDSVRRSEPLSHEEQPASVLSTPTEATPPLRVSRYSFSPSPPVGSFAADVVSTEDTSKPTDKNNTRTQSDRTPPLPPSSSDDVGYTTTPLSDHRSHTNPTKESSSTRSYKNSSNNPPSYGTKADKTNRRPASTSTTATTRPSSGSASVLPTSVSSYRTDNNKEPTTVQPPPVSVRSTRSTSNLASTTSNASINTAATAAAKTGRRTTIMGDRDEGINFVDNDDSDDGAGVSPSADRSKYIKGVSTSFVGLNATEQFDDIIVPKESLDKLATVSDAYDSIPLIEQTKLPRGGISMETIAVGRIQVRGVSIGLLSVIYFSSFG